MSVGEHSSLLINGVKVLKGRAKGEKYIYPQNDVGVKVEKGGDTSSFQPLKWGDISTAQTTKLFTVVINPVY